MPPSDRREFIFAFMDKDVDERMAATQDLTVLVFEDRGTGFYRRHLSSVLLLLKLRC